MKLLLRCFVALLVISCGVLPVVADSIWGAESASPYSTQKAYKVGDIINIIILESTAAKNVAETKAYPKDDLSLQFQHTIARLQPLIGTSNYARAGWSNKYTGTGSTKRESDVQARIAAWVTEVLPNGNLAITGKHKVEVNDEMQEITITGIVRSKDITMQNTIFSYQVANADLSVRGTGVVTEAESPGWITRILNWLF